MRIESLDLHRHTVAEAMDHFVRQYNRMLRETREGEARALEVIHGKGTREAGGLIRETLRGYLHEYGNRITGFDTQLILRGAEYLLDKYPGDLVYMHGEDATGNAGCTFVFPRRRLPRPNPWL